MRRGYSLLSLAENAKQKLFLRDEYITSSETDWQLIKPIPIQLAQRALALYYIKDGVRWAFSMKNAFWCAI